VARRLLVPTVVAVAVVVLALSACGGGGETDAAPTSSVTSVVTTAATAAPSVAPSVASSPTVAPTTAPATTAPATSEPPAVTVAPPSGLVTFTESPMATRRESTTEGVMVKASNPAFDRSFVLTMFASDVARAAPGPGWTLTPIDRDPQWTPDACGGAIRTFVGGRWEVFFDLATGPSGPDVSRAQLVAFDTRTGAMTGYLEQPNRVGWLTSTLHAYDDHTVGVLFDPSGTVDSTVGLRRLALRRIDLVTGHATDVAMPALDVQADVAWFDSDGTVLVSASPKRGDTIVYRWAPGRQPVRLSEQPAWRAEPIDGVVLGPGEADANGDLPVVDAGGAVLARIHQWRFMANGAGIGLVGWSRGRGYFGAFHDEPTGDAFTYLSPGVYDASNGIWSWVFAPSDATQSVSYFIVGTT
jgi:hypothetical protein